MTSNATTGWLARLGAPAKAVWRRLVRVVAETGGPTAAEPLRGGEAGTLADHPALIHLTMTAWSKVFRRDFLAGLGVSFGSAGPAPPGYITSKVS